jgi:pimeloyl-ACP methyl ester carboxylesterase
MLTTLQRSRTRGGAAYVDSGRGQPLLLIHGVGMRLEAWAPQVAALGHGHRVIAVDMPGHGESDLLPSGALLPDFVAWFGKVIDDLDLAKVNVAGHSMGALISGGMAASYPDRVSRVCLLNGVYRRSSQARAAVEERAAAMRNGEFDSEAPLGRWFSPDEIGTDVYRLTRDWLIRNNPQGYATAYAAFAKGDAIYADAWPKVQVPALFLTGSGDPNSTPQMSRQMAAAAPQGRCLIIEGHRHMVNLTAPDEVNAAMQAWLSVEEVPT